MNFNERFIEDRPMANFEIAFNLYMDASATFVDAQSFLNICQTRRICSQRAPQNQARREAEAAVYAEAERIENEQKAYRQDLLRQLRDNR